RSRARSGRRARRQRGLPTASAPADPAPSPSARTVRRRFCRGGRSWGGFTPVSYTRAIGSSLASDLIEGESILLFRSPQRAPSPPLVGEGRGEGDVRQVEKQNSSKGNPPPCTRPHCATPR